MKALKLHFLAPLALILTSVAGQDLGSALSLLPTCAQKCVVPMIASLPCKISTLQELASCFCPNVSARSNTSTCVQEACSFPDQLTTAHTNYALCQNFPSPSRSDELERASIVLILVSLIFVLLRGWSRLITASKLWWDDWLLFAAALSLYVILALEIPSSMKGFGEHFWSINPENIPQLLKLFYATQLFYIVSQVAIKISLLLFFLRVFPQRWFRIATIATITWIALHGVIFLFLIIFQCIPVQSIWDESLARKCTDQSAIVYIGAAFSIVEDLVILALPIPCVSALKMGLGKRFSLMVMFCVGSFACITSMIRLKYLSTYGGTDPTWDDFDVSLWSCIEIATAVICACLPALKPLLSRLLPKLFGNGTGNTYGPGLSQMSMQQESKHNIRVPDEETGTSSKARLHSDSESTMAKRGKGRRWSDDEDMELVGIEPLEVGKVNSTMTTIKTLPALPQETWSGWGSRPKGEGRAACG